MQTTYRNLSPRAAAIVAALPQDDPIVLANRLADQAVALQDAGDWDASIELLSLADELL